MDLLIVDSRDYVVLSEDNSGAITVEGRFYTLKQAQDFAMSLTEHTDFRRIEVLMVIGHMDRVVRWEGAV